ncbi:MAG: UTP--glucose-1-phosphate uridylyltransferase [Desulfomonile tiedjei]|nr:UTP--glucose-1-phosphate uridylyltransferase [Desulfomonile tiedjei]
MRLEAIEDRIRRKMEGRAISSGAVDRFLDMLRHVSEGNSGYMPLDSVATPDPSRLLDAQSELKDLPGLEERGEKLLNKVAVIKLNGGRSTTMGTRVPKGILEAKNGRSYLEIIIGQIASIRRKWRVDVPLVLMNSFFTHGPTMEIVNRHNISALTFVQNQVPRLVEDTLAPLETGTDEDWVPPGHGDVYESLRTTGLLRNLRERGCRWAFISNLDNLAACLEPWIIGLLDRHEIEFLLEVTDRTPADRKGGTLVVKNGRLDLLEIAQVAPAERDDFMDIDRFRVFNTNNVWVDLEALDRVLQERSLNLPIIQNHKSIDGIRVVQLETAMGAAIGSFPRSRGLRVGRDRFFPTKKVSDLFVLQSDVCILDSMSRLQRNPLRPASLPLVPKVYFGDDFLVSPHKLGERFEDPASVSMVLASSLEVRGPAYFERDVRIEGEVKIDARTGKNCRIPRGSVLRDCNYP